MNAVRTHLLLVLLWATTLACSTARGQRADPSPSVRVTGVTPLLDKPSASRPAPPARPNEFSSSAARFPFTAPPIFAAGPSSGGLLPPGMREVAPPSQPAGLLPNRPTFHVPPRALTGSSVSLDAAKGVADVAAGALPNNPFLQPATQMQAGEVDGLASAARPTSAHGDLMVHPESWTSSASGDAPPQSVTQLPSNAWVGAPFSPDPSYCGPYDAEAELGIYLGKWCVPTQRPWIELWRPMYAAGELPPGAPYLGRRNLIQPHFLLYGDFRSAFAYNDNGNAEDEKFIWANRLNLEFDLKITATERIHAFWGPIDEDGRFTRAEENNGQIEFFEEFDDEFDTLFFEGDAGYLWGGITDQYAPFDLPFVAGKYPLLFQNGVWIFDALEGFAFTFPAKNSPVFDWSNTDLTFFFGFDDVDSPAFGKDDNLAQVYGFNWFLEAYQGYWEIGYAYLDDTTGQGLSYNSIALAYTRRYLNRLSNSIRVIVNTGQSPESGMDTADGTLVLLENALISHDPLHFVPYCNLFGGFGRPQSVARAAGVGGILFNTGINFETDALTGYPTLDATANDTYGGAVGLNWLGPDFSWQLITEFAMVQTFGDDPQRNVQNDQYAFGMRFQLPLNNAWLVRFDSIYGILEEEPDVRGARMELRWKF